MSETMCIALSVAFGWAVGGVAYAAGATGVEVAAVTNLAAFVAAFTRLGGLGR